MKWLRIAVSALALGALAAPAGAQQGYDGALFVKAVRDRDAGKALELLRSHPAGIVNSRGDDGNTALNIVISRTDEEWTAFLIGKGADLNLGGKGGDTPLIAAARVGFEQAVHWLLGEGAKVDGANRMGETALIVAVQQRQVPIVRLLLNSGANPDKTDSAAGFSARDYAERDTRSREILRLIEAKKPKPPAAGSR